MVREILKLGNPKLYEVCGEVTNEEREMVKEWVKDLHDTLMDYRKTYGAGRAVAAPQIGVPKRLLYMYTDRPYVFINPVLTFPDEEVYELVDDCMSFPGLMVRVSRHRRADIRLSPAPCTWRGICPSFCSMSTTTWTGSWPP